MKRAIYCAFIVIDTVLLGICAVIKRIFSLNKHEGELSLLLKCLHV